MNLRDAFDPERFRASGHRLVDALADYLRDALAGGESMPVLPVTDPEVMLRDVAREMPSEPSGDLVEMLREVIARSNHLHHPGYVGHQVASVLPEATLVEMTSALLNNGMAVYEMGQMQTVMERHVVGFLAERIGFDPGAGGVLTHGGSVGNLTALLAARQAKAGYDVWTEGQREPFAVLVSEQAHYCVARSAQVMGWGSGGAVPVATDATFRMRTDDLPRALASARDAGRKVLAVVASSCSTATGSFDPIDEIADFCEAEGLWLHVDGAHGASLALSRRNRDALRGIERADSVVWDLHKLMLLPALVTGVVFRENRRSHEAFAQEASYLFGSADPETEWWDVGRRTLECTKRALGVLTYTMLHAFGTRMFEDNVDGLIDRAREFSMAVDAAEDFELAIPPECNIVCFRHTPDGADDLDAHQVRVRRAVLERGRYYIVQAGLRGETWLRVTIMNPRTSDADLVGLLDEIRSVG